jgi:glycosyltransferase 2 family protein
MKAPRLRWSWLVWVAAPFLLWFSLRGVPFQDIRGVLQNVSIWQLLALAGINLGILLLFALRWQMILRTFGTNVFIGRILAYRLAGFGISYFTPGPQFGGEPMQILLLTKREGVPASRAVSSVILDKLLELLANFTFLVLGLSVAGLSGLLPGHVNSLAWVSIASLIFFPLTHLFFLHQGFKPLTALAIRMKRRFAWRLLAVATQHLGEAEDQIGAFCRERPFELARLMGVSALAWLLSVLEFQWLLSALGGSFTLAQGISLLTALRLAFLLPIPGGLGTMEAALVLAGQAIGFSPALGISAALIIRARDVTLALVGLWIGSWALNIGQRPAENA